jgi:hypothetical protein
MSKPDISVEVQPDSLSDCCEEGNDAETNFLDLEPLDVADLGMEDDLEPLDVADLGMEDDLGMEEKIVSILMKQCQLLEKLIDK